MIRWGIRTQVLLALAVVLAFGLIASYLVTSRVTQAAVVESRVRQAREAAALVADAFEGVSVDGHALADLTARLRAITEPDMVYVLGPDMLPIADSAEGRRRFEATVSPRELAPLRQSDVAHEVVRGQDGRPLLVVMAPFVGSPRPPGTDPVRQPVAVCLLAELGPTMDRAERIERLFLLFTLIILVLAVLLGYILLGRTVIRPVHQLLRIVARVSGGGEPSPSLAIAKPSGELGQLYTAFQKMIDTLSVDRRRIQLQVSELELANREIARTQERLVRTEKLASVGELAAGVAHEIGNPIAVLQGYLEMLADPELPEERRREYLAIMETSVERIGTIIRDLLDFARPAEDAEPLCDAVAVARAAAKLVGPQKRFKTLELRLRLPAAAVPVAIPAGRLEQVLVNLLLNAADASPEDAAVELRVVARRGQVEITIADEGMGITQTGLNRIFDPFFTTKEPGKGTGLGLAVCHGIAQSYGGSIEVLSTVGKGASFTVVLPAPGGAEDQGRPDTEISSIPPAFEG
ncbi:MAG: HAMP domain-containing protein [Deltaproteobacteria bacterium]|nr:HAMP domain-containing protein [Deltaproteobacteria bacterium]MCB9788443.1 HAMP domain-containing protein [Deltaproteobacteria bacterium]